MRAVAPMLGLDCVRTRATFATFVDDRAAAFSSRSFFPLFHLLPPFSTLFPRVSIDVFLSFSCARARAPFATRLLPIRLQMRQILSSSAACSVTPHDFNFATLIGSIFSNDRFTRILLRSIGREAISATRSHRCVLNTILIILSRSLALNFNGERSSAHEIFTLQIQTRQGRSIIVSQRRGARCAYVGTTRLSPAFRIIMVLHIHRTTSPIT